MSSFGEFSYLINLLMAGCKQRCEDVIFHESCRHYQEKCELSELAKQGTTDRVLNATGMLPGFVLAITDLLLAISWLHFVPSLSLPRFLSQIPVAALIDAEKRSDTTTHSAGPAGLGMGFGVF